MVDGYGAWLDGEAEKAAKLPAPHQKAPRRLGLPAEDSLRAAPRLAGAGRDRRPVPGHPAAEAGLAAGHPRPGRRAPRRAARDESSNYP
jgi:hypothetical protein